MAIDFWEIEELRFITGFGEIKRYAEAVEELLTKLTETGITEDEIGDSYVRHVMRMGEIEREFPKILRYSLFVYNYSLFERALLRLAEEYRRDRKLALQPSELGHQGIERAHVYLKKVVLVPFPDTSLAWRNIKVFNIIRNRIVHNQGTLPEKNNKDRRKIDAFVKKWHDDISTDYDEIALHKTFIFQVIGTFYTFSDELFTGLKGTHNTQGIV